MELNIIDEITRYVGLAVLLCSGILRIIIKRQQNKNKDE